CAPTGQPKPICARRSACSRDAAGSASSSTARAWPSPAANSALMMDMAMIDELQLTRRLRRLAFALGLTLAAAGAHAQGDPAITGAVTRADGGAAAQPEGDAPAPVAARRGRSRAEIRPYLEVAQVLSADL